jgi:putative membrane protein
LKRWFRNFLALLCLDYIYAGFETSGNIYTVVLAGLLLSVIQVFFHPLLKFLWLPVNIITLGIFSWFLYVIHLLIVTYIMKSVSFIAFNYNSFSVLGISIEGGHANIIVSVLVGGIIYMFINKILEFLAK